MTDWFALLFFHVKDVDALVPFYVNLLGFRAHGATTRKAEHESHRSTGRAFLYPCQQSGTRENRQSSYIHFPKCLSRRLRPRRRVDALRAELEAKGVPVKEVHGVIDFCGR